MLEAAFIEARDARPVKAAARTRQNAVRERRLLRENLAALLPNNPRSRSRVPSRLLTVYSVHGLSPAGHDLTAWSGGEVCW
jgi:hypothetical protein